jgi:spore coat-associated protein N
VRFPLLWSNNRRGKAVNTQLVRHPRRTLGALATALAAIGVAIGSGADFSAESANPSNTFTAGSLTMDDSRAGAAIVNPANLKPGAPPQTGTVDIENTGTIDGTFSLSRDELASTDGGDPNPTEFAAKLNLTVTDCGESCGDAGDREVYAGTLAGMNDAVSLGRFAAGDSHRYQFAAALDASTGDEYEGDSSSARFVWDAVQ